MRILFGCYIVFLLIIDVACYPAEGRKRTIMDEIYEEIQGYVNSKRDGIAHSEELQHKVNSTQQNNSSVISSDAIAEAMKSTKVVLNVTADEKANELDHFLASGESNSTNSTFAQDEDTNASVNDLNEELQQNDAESNELKFNSTASVNDTYNNDQDIAEDNSDDGSANFYKSENRKDDGSGNIPAEEYDSSYTSGHNKTTIGNHTTDARRNGSSIIQDVSKATIMNTFSRNVKYNATNIDIPQENVSNMEPSQEKVSNAEPTHEKVSTEDDPVNVEDEDSPDDLDKSFTGERINITQNYDNYNNESRKTANVNRTSGDKNNNTGIVSKNVQNDDSINHQSDVSNNLRHVDEKDRFLNAESHYTATWNATQHRLMDKMTSESGIPLYTHKKSIGLGERPNNASHSKSVPATVRKLHKNTTIKEDNVVNPSTNDVNSTSNGDVNSSTTSHDDRRPMTNDVNNSSTGDIIAQHIHRLNNAFKNLQTTRKEIDDEEDNDIHLNLFKPLKKGSPVNKESTSVMSLVNMSDSLGSTSKKEWENDDVADEYMKGDNTTIDGDSMTPVYTPWGLSRNTDKHETNVTATTGGTRNTTSEVFYHVSDSKMQVNETNNILRETDSNDTNVFLPNPDSTFANSSSSSDFSDGYDQEPSTMKKESDSAVNVLKSIVGNLGENDQDLNFLLSNKNESSKIKLDDTSNINPQEERTLSNASVKTFRNFDKLNKSKTSIFLSDAKHASVAPDDGEEVRIKRHYFYDHNHNIMGMHNHPYHEDQDFMHGGGHDEFHSIDDHGNRMDLGSIETMQQPHVDVHQSPNFDIHEEPHFHHYEPHNEYKEIHNEPQYYHQNVHQEPHYHSNFYHDDPHYEQNDYHYHDNHHEHYHHQPHYLHNEVHIHHDHENFHDQPEEYHSGDSEDYHHRRFHHVKVKLHGPGKSPGEWADQEDEENSQMPEGEHDELNNYDTGAGFFQLDENGGDVEITSLHKTGTKVHMGGGQFSVIRDPWRYHSAFAGMFHPQESVGRRAGSNGGDGIQQFHQHFTYINNNRNENHKVQNLVHHEHEPEHEHHEHHYQEHHDDHHKHHDHEHHGESDGDDDDHHDDDHHHHHHEEDQDHHHYEEHRVDHHHLNEHPQEDDGYQRDIKLYPGSEIHSSEQETGTPNRDNMKEDRTPTGDKRTVDHTRDTAKITPKDAEVITGDDNAVKRDDMWINTNLGKITLDDPIDSEGPKKAYFTGLKHENEAESSGESNSEEPEERAIKDKVRFDGKSETKNPDILNIQQFHVNGPSNLEPWVTREFVAPISPMVVKRNIQSTLRKHRTNVSVEDSSRKKSRQDIIRKAFFKTRRI